MKVIDISPTHDIFLLFFFFLCVRTERIDCVFMLRQQSADKVKKLEARAHLSVISFPWFIATHTKCKLHHPKTAKQIIIEFYSWPFCGWEKISWINFQKGKKKKIGKVLAVNLHYLPECIRKYFCRLPSACLDSKYLKNDIEWHMK